MLLKKGAVEECESTRDQFLSTYFLIEKKDSSYRFTLNLKDLNVFVRKEHFKMENIKTASNLVFPEFYMANIDLADAYYLVPVHPESRKYLRFEFKGKIFQFTCLPNGLSSAPYIFTKLLKPVINKLRSEGHLSVIYLDDILCIGEDFEACAVNVKSTITLLRSLGFIIHDKKCVLKPSKKCKFLGFVIDSEKFWLEITVEKSAKIAKLIERFLKLETCTIQEFAQLIGSLMAACPAVEYGFLYTKYLEMVKIAEVFRNNGNYNAKMRIPSIVKPDLIWWGDSISTTVNPIKKGVFEMEIYTDASNSGGRYERCRQYI